MFDRGFDLSGDAGLWSALTESCTEENKAAFWKVATAALLWELWTERDVALGASVVDCGNAALAEIAVRLGCSKTVAHNHAEFGMTLRLRLPRIRDAFAAGEIDYARVAAICRATNPFRSDTAAAVESDILAAARVLSPGPLRSEIDTILIRTAPDEYAEVRAKAMANRRLRKRRTDSGLSRVEADLAPEEAEAVWQRVLEVADSVCRHDKRGRQYRIADAFLALIHGADRLACTCGGSECTAANYSAPGRRKPLVQISIDVATLLGLLANPAHLHGYGPIDPDLARTLAADATWQALLSDALEQADASGLIDHAAAGKPDDSAEPEHTRAPRPPVCNSAFRSPRPRRFAAGKLPTGMALAMAHLVDAHGSIAVAEIHAERLANDPTKRTGPFPDGHGGYLEPPPGALTYTPDAHTASVVRARDQHCRFPGCRRPAKQCQLDHVVPFKRRSPRTGGWTVPGNLQCVCRFHHQLKTMKLWQAVMLSGAAVRWISPYGTDYVTAPANPHTATAPSELIPIIRYGPKGSPPESEYDDAVSI